jgi:hypothetical protein
MGSSWLLIEKMLINVMLFRVNRQVFSYNQIKAQLREVYNIQKEYGDDEICSGFILPHEVSTIPPPSSQLTLIFFFFLDNSMNGSLQLILDKFLQPMYHC